MENSASNIFISNIEKRISLTEEDKTVICSAVKCEELKKGDFLLQAGESSHYQYFVLKGCLRTYTIDQNGFEHILMFSIEDWWAGDIYSFLNGTPASFFIEALEGSSVIKIDKAGLEKIENSIPLFEKYQRIIIQNAFINLQLRLVQNLSYTAEQRFLEFEKKYPHLLERISQKQIAAFLGITPEFLSVLRKKLVKK